MRYRRTLTLTRHPQHADIWLTRDGQVYRQLSHRMVGSYPYLRGAPFAKSMHRLMLETFVGLMPKNKQGLHADDDKMNWRADNLRWGTTYENNADRVRNGKTTKGGNWRTRR